MGNSQPPKSPVTGTEDPRDTNAAEVGDSNEVEDTLYHQLVELTQPSPSPKIPVPRAVKRRVARKTFHAVQDMESGKYKCLCGSKFKSKQIQIFHIKHFNSIWKFTCEQCPKRFFQLSGLKLHLKRQHGMEKPLSQYVCGCTQCGEKFETRAKFEKHLKEKQYVSIICMTPMKIHLFWSLTHFS